MAAAVTIASLHVYPVKGCAAVSVPSLSFDSNGLIIGDRIAMIVDPATGEFVSQRHLGAMARLRATLVTPTTLELIWQDRLTAIFARPTEAKPIAVTVWDDAFLADDGGDATARWLSDALGSEVRLAWLRGPSGRTIDPYWAGVEQRTTSFADLAPLLVTNAASLDNLNARRAESGRAAIEMLRFRPNVVVSGIPAFGEDAITELHGESVTLRLIKPCARCGVIELDPRDGISTNDEVLRSLAPFRSLQNRKGTRGILFGQNAIAITSAGGEIRVGDCLLHAVRSPEIA